MFNKKKELGDKKKLLKIKEQELNALNKIISLRKRNKDILKEKDHSIDKIKVEATPVVISPENQIKIEEPNLAVQLAVPLNFRLPVYLLANKTEQRV